jgi:hypothetical protein
MTQTLALFLLFIVLPLVVAPIVVAVVARRSPELPNEYRTSSLLADGRPVTAQLTGWRNRAMFFLDRRPMVALSVTLDTGEALTITQSVPRPVLSKLRKGMDVEVRLAADGKAGAVVLPDE